MSGLIDSPDRKGIKTGMDVPSILVICLIDSPDRKGIKTTLGRRC